MDEIISMTTHQGLIKRQMSNSNKNAKMYWVLLCANYSCMYLHILADFIQTTTLWGKIKSWAETS